MKADHTDTSVDQRGLQYSYRRNASGAVFSLSNFREVVCAKIIHFCPELTPIGSGGDAALRSPALRSPGVEVREISRRKKRKVFRTIFTISIESRRP